MDDRRIRVLIADDHPVGRLAVELSLRHDGAHDIVSIATSASELVFQLGSKDCDVLISDFAMPKGSHADGLELLSWIRERFAHIRIVVLTSLSDPAAVMAMLDLGIACLVSKVDGPRHVCVAVRAAYEGRGYLSPFMAKLAGRPKTGWI